MMQRAVEIPILTTERLTLRGWCQDDLDAYSAMLADPATARFITRSGRPLSKPQAWAEMAFFAGHWQLLGYGMFVVERRDCGRVVGRVGLLEPEGWPGLELAWALSPAERGHGYASEAASAVLVWSSGRLANRRTISVIHPDNRPSQRIAERLGMARSGEWFAPFGEPCELWALEQGSVSTG